MPESIDFLKSKKSKDNNNEPVKDANNTEKGQYFTNKKIKIKRNISRKNNGNIKIIKIDGSKIITEIFIVFTNKNILKIYFRIDIKHRLN